MTLSSNGFKLSFRLSFSPVTPRSRGSSGAPDYGNDFVFVMRTTEPGEAVTIPCQNTGTFNAEIDWGDGTTTSVATYNSAGLSHEYATAGEHVIRVSGQFPNIYFNNGGDKDKLRKVIQLGDVGWTRLLGAFYGCFASGTYDDDYFTTGPCDTSQVVIMQDAMRGWTAVTTAPNLEGMSASNNAVFRAMFRDSPGVALGLDLAHWATGAGLDFWDMFNGVDGAPIPLSAGIHNFNLAAATNLINFAAGAQFTTEAYDAILIAWAAQEPPSGLSVNFGTSTCTKGGAAEAARTELIEAYGWTIVDSDSRDTIDVGGPTNVVMIGASIINSICDTAPKRAELERLLRQNGILGTVYDRANGGETSVDLNNRIDSVIAEFSGQEANTLYVMHTLGNNVSQSGPYPGGFTSGSASFRAIIEKIQASGSQVIASTITYRIPPASNPTAPYNDGIVIPITAELTPELMRAGRPALDLYELTFNNQSTWYSADGIHPNEVGQQMTREYIAEVVGGVVVQTGMPDAEDYIQDVVIRFGRSTPGFMGGNNSLVEQDTALTELYESDGVTQVAAPVSIIASNFDGTNTTGKGNPGDTSISLTNNDLLTAFLYTDNNTPSTVSIVGVDPLGTYTVSITGSRNTTGPLIGDYTIGGVTKQLDASLEPPPIVTFEDVSGYDILQDGLAVMRQLGSTFAYLSGMRLTRQND